MAENRQDRELIELLNELRVALPGVQVLFAFLLMVPFSQAFAKVSEPQKDAYLIALLSAAMATALLIAPTSYHRIQFRARDKEALLKTSNVYAIAGTGFLALAVTASLFMVTDFIFGGALAIVVTAFFGVLFTLLWYALPLFRRAEKNA